MTGRSHLVIGTVTAAAAATATTSDATTAAILIAAAIMTAKLPDIDMRLGIRHRGVTHTILALLFLGAVVFAGMSIDRHTVVYATTATAGVLIGYGMHLLADACTIRGVALLAPAYRDEVHLLPRALRIRTGSWQEMVVVVLIATGVIGLTAHAQGAL